MKDELHQQTKLLMRQLGYFIVHVLSFLVGNTFLISTTFSNANNRWWIVSLVIAWAIGLIYHGLRIYGVDPLSAKNKKTKLFWSWVFKLSGI